MKVTEVEYRETQSFGRFNNITVGMKAIPDSNETEKHVYETLKCSVQQAIKERIAEELPGPGQTVLTPNERKEIMDQLGAIDQAGEDAEDNYKEG